MPDLNFTDWFGFFSVFILITIFRNYWISHKRVRKLQNDKSFWIKKDAPPCNPDTKVSIIIPARDEENNIGDCVHYALAQTHQNIEVIVLDDNSSDNTLKILQEIDDPRLKIIQSQEALPEGWKGKPWACQRAAKQASGEWMMFIDADVRIEPETVAAIIGYTEQHQYQYLTGLDHHILKSFGERLIHSHFLFNLGFQRDWYAVNDPDSPVSVGNGRFMVFRADTFENIGGFKAVADKVLEDEAFGKLIKEKKIPFHANGLMDLVEVRMYTSTSEVIIGWVKTVSGSILDGNDGKKLSWSKALLFTIILTLKFLLWDVFAYLTLLMIFCAQLPFWVLPFSLAAIILDHRNRWIFANMLRLQPGTDLFLHFPGQLISLPIYLFSLYKAVKGTATWKGRQLSQ